ncbi:2-dehydro-3-deoxygluconokinase [Pseudobythopirellula maris]|uniref:2-dehydro-3-deoxygluconokinase n=1 Tax=Pseudobythopirellula maris TaxID=2527991 RepID=A0A5C5ZQL5_9BACT|nr:sugar kinase [Pseudobythopirellula maris]TWT89759.1 2-dehydro-3-deoxygluconokinase [Pseudobythopirellula maris]
MPPLTIKPADSCRFDEASLGEVMLRLDPGDGRVRTTRTFQAWEGGGEYNVARGLKRCFGLRTTLVSSFVDNEVGRLLEDLIYTGGVDQSFVQWRKFDGVGREARNGMNFTERGFGLRGAVGCSDRGHTAASQMKPGDIDWDELFGKQGVRWLHTGGIFAALSDTTPAVVEEALTKAKEHGVVTSYDLNYRPSLWKAIGGHERCQEVNRRLAKLVDVMIGNEEDFTACLGLEVEGVGDGHKELPLDAYKRMIERAVKEYPNFAMTATTLRAVKSATVNDWGALAWHDGQFYEATQRNDLEIFDRVGGGDSFASGLIYGMLTTGDPQQAVEYGAAHGALAMTTPGDTTMASLAEVEKLVAGAGARVDR